MIVWNRKDGGPESKVSMYGIEIKRLFSVLLLRFDEGSREAYHSHAFESWSIVLSGMLLEMFTVDSHIRTNTWITGDIIRTRRSTVHKVYGLRDTTWVLSFRGPWVKNWFELLGEGGQERVDLTVGRIKNAV